MTRPANLACPRPLARLMASVAIVLTGAALSACGGSGDTAPAPEPPPFGGSDVVARILAATATAQSSSNACAAIRPFYWEVGNANIALASGSVNAPGNTTTYSADTVMPIASASKWLYGAYVAERRGGALTAEDIEFLSFRSGYTSFAPIGDCFAGDTVAACVARGDNDVQTAAHVGKFFYNGGHMQKHASLAAPGMALGGMNSAALATELRRVLGNDINLSFSQPQPAGGVRTSAADYAVFLRKLLRRELQLGALLGAHKVCTNPATCADAVSTPIAGGLDWHYSLGHWVEDDATRGDGAFSSAGAFGFYPWIEVGKLGYGIVARADMAGSGNESGECGALIRAAWESSVAR